MTRLVMATGVMVLLLSAPIRGLAGEPASSPVRDTPAATAADAGGCMPGGGCCGGGGACANAAKANEGEAGGGCPCKKRRELQEKAARLRDPKRNP
jgi:hypothetical protein